KQLAYLLYYRVYHRYSQLQRLEAASQCLRGIWIHHRPEQPPRLLDWRHERSRTRDHSAGHVAVAVEIFCRALHREIDAEGQRLLIDRAREGVVDDRQDAPRPARGGNPPDVDAPERRIDRRLEPGRPRPLRAGPLPDRERLG